MTDFKPIRIAVMTVSDSRNLDTDTSGNTLVELLSEAGHELADRAIVRDDMDPILSRLHAWVDNQDIDCVITTGGTGVTGRDVTPEALKVLGGKEIPGFGELFRLISFQKIGTSAIQSRAMAIVTRRTYIFALPGSTGAVRDAWEGILAQQLDIRHKPCNFVELMPRLIEPSPISR